MKPEMFFGQKKIDIYHLYYYLLGYNGARMMYGIADEKDEKFGLEFNTWVNKKVEGKIEHDTFWASSISQIAAGSVEEPTEHFFCLFAEFFGIEL